MRLRRVWLVLPISAIAACGLARTGTGEDVAGGATDARSPTEDASVVADGSENFVDAGGDAPSDANAVDAADATIDAGTIFTTISPYDPSGSLTYALPIQWTLASDPPLPIYYTTDGSTPTQSSKSGTSPVIVNRPSDNTTIKWIVDKDPTVHSFLVRVDPNLENNTTGMVDDFAFNTTSSTITHAAPNANLTGYIGDTWAWNSNAGSGAISQLTYGVNKGVGCFTDEVAGVYAGQHHTNIPFAMTAPSTPGVYTVGLGFELQLDCAPDALGRNVTRAQIGTIIVP